MQHVSRETIAAFVNAPSSDSNQRSEEKRKSTKYNRHTYESVIEIPPFISHTPSLATD